MENKNDTRISKIVRQFLGNRYSEKTEKRVQRWLIDDRDSKEKEEASFAFWNTLEGAPDAATYRSLKKVNARTGFPAHQPHISHYRIVWRVAAVVIPFLMLAGGLYYFQKEPMIQIATAYGETKQILLPDSSEVWLNSGTTIQYPEKFKKNARNIRLEGEAYFSVKKDAAKPFVVQTSTLSVKVLGTTFNIKAYQDDNKTIATLNSGKIEIETNTKQSRVLRPNEQLTYNSQTSDVDVKEISADDASGWTTGQLIFTNASFSEMLETLERRFDVTFEMQTTVGSKEGYTVKFLKNDDLEQILSILKDVVGSFSYQRAGGKIKITTTKDTVPMK